MRDFTVTRFRDVPVSFYEANKKLSEPYIKHTDKIIHEVISSMIEMRDQKMYEASDLVRNALARCGITVGFSKDGNAVVQVDFFGWSFKDERTHAP